MAAPTNQRFTFPARAPPTSRPKRGIYIAIIATAANGSKMTQNYRANYLLNKVPSAFNREYCRRGEIARSDRYHC
ncbi:hypothetical protein KCP70_18410 [Salmonella enterica subsp. enterica]|nr:hypothetical protein KCP70_18410 [Salmonella enterica subsp. enterica]